MRPPEITMTPKTALPFTDVAAPVAAALAAGKPVVALESTIITHGMPYPDNAAMAAQVETIIRDEGATPATIAVIGGRLKIGLSDGEREALATTDGAMKLSRADLGFAIAEGRTGGTTVAAMVFATGGIGGVHKGAEESLDISADLGELARTPVIVVSAGAKAILDIEKTLEVLETHGVPVLAYGADLMPAFWSRHSPHAAPLRLDTPEAIARFFETRRALGLGGGMLVGNPVPETDEIPAQRMAAHIAAAQEAARAQGITGKAVTPFLLGKLLELTDGASLRTNIALVENNARFEARSGQRRKLDLDAPVLGPPAGGRVVGDRPRLAEPGHREAARIDALGVEVAGDGKGAALRELEVVVVVAGGIGVAIHVDHGAVELLQHQRHRIQRRIEARHHRVLIGGEGDVRRHVQDDLVADAGDADAGAAQLLAQRRLVLVHGGADGAAGERADARADQRVAAVVAAGQQADARAETGADRSAAQRVRNLLFAGIGVGGAGADEYAGGQNRDGCLLHQKSLSSMAARPGRAQIRPMPPSSTDDAEERNQKLAGGPPPPPGRKERGGTNRHIVLPASRPDWCPTARRPRRRNSPSGESLTRLSA